MNVCPLPLVRVEVCVSCSVSFVSEAFRVELLRVEVISDYILMAVITHTHKQEILKNVCEIISCSFAAVVCCMGDNYVT